MPKEGKRRPMAARDTTEGGTQTENKIIPLQEVYILSLIIPSLSAAPSLFSHGTPHIWRDY